MNIDLLFTEQGEAGLVADKGFPSPVAGVMFDTLTGLIALELANADSLDLNIPAGQETGQILSRLYDVHVGIIEHGLIADSRQVPIILLNDPFGGGNAGHFAVKPRRSVTAFENFMRRCQSGQPVHRDDLGDEASTASVLGGISTAVLQFAPNLARQRQLERAPPTPAPVNAPSLGLGGRGGGGTYRAPPQQTAPPRERDDD